MYLGKRLEKGYKMKIDYLTSGSSEIHSMGFFFFLLVILGILFLLIIAYCGRNRLRRERKYKLLELCDSGVL